MIKIITSWHDNEPLFFLIDSLLKLGQKYKKKIIGFWFKSKLSYLLSRLTDL